MRGGRWYHWVAVGFLAVAVVKLFFGSHLLKDPPGFDHPYHRSYRD